MTAVDDPYLQPHRIPRGKPEYGVLIKRFKRAITSYWTVTELKAYYSKIMYIHYNTFCNKTSKAGGRIYR